MSGFRWLELSPKGGIILRQIALRVSAGMTHGEVAAVLQGTRKLTRLQGGELEDLKPPPVVTEGWVSSRLRDLRRELETLRVKED